MIASPDIPPRATGWKLHTPNALVGLRLILSVGVFWILATHDAQQPRTLSLLLAAGLFVLAAATDALDGLLARRWNAITRFGRVMDPLADKILVLGALVLLAGPAFDAEGKALGGFTGWMVIIIISRELLVTSLRGLAEAAGVDASANWAGKVKMILQSAAVPTVLLTLALLEADTAHATNRVLAMTTTVVTAASALPYVRIAISESRGSGEGTS